MASSLLQIFEQYQKARVQFVQSVAEAATRPQNIDTMQNAGVMQLLRPLLLDNVPSIQQTAALALGLRLWIPGLIFWALGHSAAVMMARSDPDFMAVASRSARHKGYLKC